ncbi:DUF6623 family protein [Actinomadura oligospora]|uniref:DUF6623 family protein n=1 Tax=Actinomadura oligospora TaxID=111804 RepID=UPI0012F9BD87|nr:DUF6623 family protein [Actinomadura oligospora]
MAISQAMWVHGHALQNENPALTVGRIGWAGQIRHPGTSGWYHLAIPTAVIITDIRLRVDAAMVMFSTGAQGSIKSFHVWDGDNKILGLDGLNLTGTNVFSRFVLPQNPRPSVRWGLGISIFTALGTDPNAAWVDIHSGGVDLI